MDDVGSCSNGHDFSYRMIHNGFNDTAFAYCDTCGRTALLSMWSKTPAGVVLGHGSIKPEIEPYLVPCECGGRFRSDASPRCPSCKTELSADAATIYIEKNAPGAAKGWRWQRNWRGLYAIIIENRVVRDPWDDAQF